MHIIIPCKYKKEWMKKSREKVETPFFFHHNTICYHGNQWLNLPEFQTYPRSHYVIIPASMKRIQSRTAEKKWRHRFSHYKPMGIFSVVQGHLTLQSVVRAGRNSNSSELSRMSSLPASMKRIGWKTGEKKWRNLFLHYSPMGAFCCHGNQSSDPIWPKTKWSLSPNPMMLQIKFGCDQPIGFIDIHARMCEHTDRRTPATSSLLSLRLWWANNGCNRTQTWLPTLFPLHSVCCIELVFPVCPISYLIKCYTIGISSIQKLDW